MGVRIRATAAVLVLVTVSIFAFVMTAPLAAAASTTWTTDTDFNQAGSSFLSTEVIGTGVAAKVELIRSTTDWANKNPSSPTPGSLESPTMAYDESGGVTVLFGGYDGLSPNLYSDKTWEYNWNLNTWTEITGSPKPPLRQSGALSYDPVEQVIVLFGGYNDTDFLTDTWEYDVTTNTWAPITTSPTPPMMATYTLVYDSSAARHIMVGSDFGQNVVLWVYDAAADTWLQRFPSGTPSPRSGFATAYHAGRSRTVLFGGSMFMTLYGQTYEYNYGGNSWSLTSSGGPSARAALAMAYRPSDTSVILYGGLSGAGKMQDTWQYTAGAAWAAISTFNSPPARNYHAMAGDSGNDVVLVYGGLNPGSSRLGDTWSLGASYAAAGKYTSAVFNAGGASVNWDRIFWNQTAPSPHFLRFQIATSITPGGPFNFIGGAGCTVSSYYTSPNAVICAANDGQQYLKFLADFGSFDTQFTPSMEDVTISYVVPPAAPCIIYTDPADVTFGVLMTKDPIIGFSEPMNRSSLAVTFVLGTAVIFTPVWSNGDSTVTLTHPGLPFSENMVYRLLIDARDLDGTPLSPTCPGGAPAAPNPFTFVTEKIFPWIVKTTPVNNYGFVPPAFPITNPLYIDFSEPMNTASVVVTPSPGATFTPLWTNGDRNLSLTPSPPLAPCGQYTITVTGKDKANNDLVPGPVPIPFNFYTECKDPFLSATNPMHFGMDVALNSPIIIDFSEPMLTASVSVNVVPGISLTWTWSNGNRRYTGTHTQAFPTCTVYTVTVAGTDVDGNPLVPNPVNPNVKNPFKFMTLCDNPSIMLTIPEDGAVNVPTNQQIDVAFSDQMNEGSVTFSVTPPLTTMTPFWDASVFMHIPHVGFRQCTRYTVRILSGVSLTGFPLVQGFAPNPWSFDTVCTAPYITDTNPANDSFLVPLNAPIWVNFSEPMDTTQVIDFSIPSVTFTRTWSNGDRTLRLDHAAPFAECTLYRIFIDGLDLSGDSLLTGAFTPGAPNPWEFTTICIVTFPYIILTDPANQQQNVPLDKSIVVDFSEAMDRTSFSWIISPGIALTATWTNGDTRVTLVHTTNFLECRTYSIQVFGQDLNGEPLGTVPGSKPNPWSFKTTCLPPQILITDPANGETDVPLDRAITVTFSEAMSRSSVSWIISPTITLTSSWSVGDTVLRLAHAAAFQPLTQYCVSIFGQDVDGNSLVPGPVPNPWCFTTGAGLPEPQGLRVTRLDPNIRLDWDFVLGAAGYRVYTSTNRFAAFPSGWSFTDVTLNTHTYNGHYIDGLNRYYVVRARDASSGLSGNSTMGSKIPLAFSFSTARSNAYWISLPFNSMYDQASDITSELGSSRIDVVAKWNAATQSSILYFFFRNAWRGVNFAIGPGDALWIGVRSAFSWVLNGTDRDVSLSFTYFPPPNANLHWISLPHTSAYARASDIVKAIEGGIGIGTNTKIIEVAKWDGLTQQYVKFLYGGTGWSGTDFVIASGEAIYLKVVSSFAWTPQLLTPEVP